MSEITKSHNQKNDDVTNSNDTNIIHSQGNNPSNYSSQKYSGYKLSGTSNNSAAASKPNQNKVNSLNSNDDNQAKAQKLYLLLHKKLAKIKNDVLEGSLLSPKPIIKYIPALVKFVNSNNILLLKALNSKRYGEWFESHSVNVAIFAIKIGTGMEYNKEKLYSLTFSALLHDVGMIEIPETIKSKPGEFSNKERNKIEKHPEFGLEIIKHLKDEYPFLYKVVHQEHERYDGKGYPQGLKGKEIFEFARIIHICDIFEALNHSRSYRKHFKNTEAYHKLLEYKGKQLDPDILKVFMTEFTMFPVGSKVVLNSGEVAQVISVNKARPARPKLKVIKDSNGNKVKEPFVIDLEKEPLMRISETIY